jgi:hypothetical protein
MQKNIHSTVNCHLQTLGVLRVRQHRLAKAVRFCRDCFN